jgi:hypothetical protein
MQVTLEVPEDLARLLGSGAAGQHGLRDLSLQDLAMEALALERLRTGKITVAQARRLLGISSRYEMDGFLKTHGILLPLTAEDVQRDADTALAFRNG